MEEIQYLNISQQQHIKYGYDKQIAQVPYSYVLSLKYHTYLINQIFIWLLLDITSAARFKISELGEINSIYVSVF